MTKPGPIRRKFNKASILIESLFVGFLLFPDNAHSQTSNGGNELADAVEYAIQTLPASQLGLYNGTDYTPSTIIAGGHPYFLREEFRPEKITFDGIPYSDIYLIFDATRQLVVIEDHAGNKICPVDEKIESFTVGVHTFKQISDVAGLPPGFYDVLVDNKLFAKRSKSEGGMQYRSSTNYFFVNGDKLFRLINKKSVFESMADKENDIRHYIRLHNLSFKKKKESSLIEVVKYYSSLKQ